MFFVFEYDLVLYNMFLIRLGVYLKLCFFLIIFIMLVGNL